MKKIIWIFVGVLFTHTACDLQPKILSLPDSVGDFISARYPALLADPNMHPEIYNSAATDYGVYASPDLYGFPSNDDYVMYASVDDYIVPPQVQDVDSGQEIVLPQPIANDDYITVPMYGTVQEESKSGDFIIVSAGDTLYSIAKKNNTTIQDVAKINGLQEPYVLSVGQKLYLKKSIPQQEEVTEDKLVVARPVKAVHTVTKVDVDVITVGVGDTLYSISRKYSVPVNDLAVMNNLSVPFNLSVGQKLRVPNLADAPVVTNKVGTKAVASDVKKTEISKVKETDKKAIGETQSKIAEKVATPAKKISSDPNKKLPKINGRSSSKFSWPVQGKILSNYGAKSNGLFNDGINISAKLGSAVKAAENGVVAYAGNEVKGMGNLIIIQHDGGWMTVYAHLDSMDVKRGVRVSVGQKIGTIGETGKVDSPQLHFEIRKGTKAYDPKVYLKK